MNNFSCIPLHRLQFWVDVKKISPCWEELHFNKYDISTAEKNTCRNTLALHYTEGDKHARSVSFESTDNTRNSYSGFQYYKGQ